MTRWLARLLALLLVPVVIVALPTVSEAATVRGAALPYQFHYGTKGLDNVDCAGNAQWVRTSDTLMSVDYNGKCVWGVSIQQAGPSGPDAGSWVRAEFRGIDSSNAACTLSGVQSIQGDGNASYAGSAGAQNAGQCSITQMCLTVHEVVNNFMDPADRFACVDLALGLPPTSSGASCSYGDPTAKPYGIGYWATIFNTRYGLFRAPFRWNNGTGPGNALGSVPPVYHKYLVRKDPASGALSVVGTETGGSPYGWESTGGGEGDFAASLGESDVPNIVGMGYVPGPLPTAWSDTNSNWMKIGNAPDGGGNGGIVGTNDPGACIFYYGQKITDIAGTTVDDPADTLGSGPDQTVGGLPPVSDPPTAPDNGCNPSVTDPGSWGCAMTGLLSKIWNVLNSIWDTIKSVLSAIGSLAGKIVDGILNGLGDVLKGLFVPPDGWFRDQLNQVKDAWSNTPIGVIGSMFSKVGDALQAPTSSGCEGPAVDATFPSLGPGGGSAHTFHPLSTCSDAMSKVASIAKTGLTVLAYVGAALLALRIVAASFGLQVSLGKGDD